MIERLVRTGHKLTAPRRRVLEALRAADGPLSAQEVAERAGTTVASTYRALALLAELGIVSEVEEHGGVMMAGAPQGEGHLEGRTRRYALCTLSGHHHHFVCRTCHTTLDVQSEALERALAELEQRAGLDIERHEVLLSGRCPRCSGHTPEASGDLMDLSELDERGGTRA
ncbi:MAG TPA: Fur family transcriptional regulator [Ktedonobacterales bacterium]